MLAGIEIADGAAFYACPLSEEELNAASWSLRLALSLTIKFGALKISNGAGLHSSVVSTLSGFGDVPDISKKGFAKENNSSISCWRSNLVA